MPRNASGHTQRNRHDKRKGTEYDEANAIKSAKISSTRLCLRFFLCVWGGEGEFGEDDFKRVASLSAFVMDRFRCAGAGGGGSSLLTSSPKTSWPMSTKMAQVLVMNCP